VILFSLGQKRTDAISPDVDLIQTQNQIAPQVRELDINEMMTAKFIIEALAERNSLPVAVRIEGKNIRIKAKDDTAIRKYDGIIGFLSSLRGLPYSFEYKELCIGKGCGNQINIVLEVQK
jgi:hypothetical protein